MKSDFIIINYFEIFAKFDIWMDDQLFVGNKFFFKKVFLLKIIFNVRIILQISAATAMAISSVQRNFGNFSTKCPEIFNVVDSTTIDFKPGVRSLTPIPLHVIILLVIMLLLFFFFWFLKPLPSSNSLIWKKMGICLAVQLKRGTGKDSKAYMTLHHPEKGTFVISAISNPPMFHVAQRFDQNKTSTATRPQKRLRHTAEKHFARHFSLLSSAKVPFSVSHGTSDLGFLVASAVARVSVL